MRGALEAGAGPSASGRQHRLSLDSDHAPGRALPSPRVPVLALLGEVGLGGTDFGSGRLDVRVVPSVHARLRDAGRPVLPGKQLGVQLDGTVVRAGSVAELGAGEGQVAAVYRRGRGHTERGPGSSAALPERWPARAYQGAAGV